MRLSYFIAKRVAFNRERTFSRFIIRIALIATALSVAVMILTVALVNGFQEVISNKIFDFSGHIHVTEFQPYPGVLSEDVPFEASDSLKEAIEELPEISSVSAYAVHSVIFKANEEIEGAMIKGISSDYDRSHLEPYIKEGNLLELNKDNYSDEVVLSKGMADRLKVAVGDPVIGYFVQEGRASPRARKLQVSGIYETNIADYDQTYAIGDINLIRRISDWDSSSIGGYEIFIHDYKQMDKVVDELYDQVLPEDLSAISIHQLYNNIFDWLNLQNMNEFIILIIMTIVAVINMITAILILILERTNMVGVLKSIGMNNWKIQKIFLYHTTYIVIFGLLIGNFFGLGLAWLQKTTHFFKLEADTYYMPYAPIKIEWWQILAIDLGTFVICLLILIIPSLIIRSISPLKAVRFR